MVDSTCAVWRETCSGGVGACVLYDIEEFRYKFFGVSLLLRAATVLLQALALVYVCCTQSQVFQPHLDTSDTVDTDNMDMTPVTDHKTPGTVK